MNLGLAYLFAGKIENAVREFQHCIEISPKDERPYISLSGIFLNLSEYEKAESVLRLLLNQHPDSFLGRYNMGIASFRRGSFGEASTIFSKLISEDPANIPARYYLALTLEKAGKTSKAISEFERVVSTSPLLLEAGFHLGVLYHKNNEREKARTLFNKVFYEAKTKNPPLSKRMLEKLRALGISIP